MNKKILLLTLALSILSSGFGVFAEENIPATVEDPNVVTEIEEKSGITAEVVYAQEDGMNFEEDVLLFDNFGNKITSDEIKKDDLLTIFKNSEGKTLIAVLRIGETESNADFDFYKTSDTYGMLINNKNTLAISFNEETTEVIDLKGNEITDKNLENKYLLVFYTIVQLSIPGQTTPEKIIVVDESIVNPGQESEENTTQASVEIKAEDVVKSEDITMLPLRIAVEGLGLEVNWDNELKKITVGTIPMGVNFVIGVNEYAKSRMMPYTLSKAPELVVSGDFGVTYVPVDFFTQVLDAEVVENQDGTVTIKR